MRKQNCPSPVEKDAALGRPLMCFLAGVAGTSTVYA